MPTSATGSRAPAAPEILRYGPLPDAAAVARLIIEAAEAEVMPRFRRLLAHEVQEKARGEVVTVVDHAVERRLEAALRDLTPGSAVLGEEAAAADARRFDLLRGGEPVWIVDPLDGTSNFTGGVPVFALMVAFARSGEILQGWIYDPVARRMASAARGEGAWCDGERLRVAPAGDPAAMTGALLAGFFGRRDLARKLAARRDRVRTVPSLRCAGHEYLRLAGGRTQFALFSRLMPWDHAPGVLIHREAGGHGAYLEGGLFDPARIDASGLLLAPDRPSWEALRHTLVGP
ncbi:MAG: inositol monophosphatase [Rhodospirillaceae bacterium]|nr:inositol monophosphatase [Rhodospirillaceae bacterium]